MVIYGHALSEMSFVFDKLSILNLVVMTLCFVNAVFLLESSKNAYISSSILIVAMLANNWWVGKISTDYSMLTTTIATTLFLLMNSLMLLPKVKMALVQPDKQWWRTAPRKKVGVPMVVSPWLDGVSFSSATFDISESGAFISEPEKNSALTLKPNDYVEIRFQIAGFYQIRCSAKVVRVQKKNGSYPVGMGIQFQEMDSKDQKVLRRFLNGEMSV